MLGAIAHVGITVRDMDKAVEFYRDTLGLKVIGDVTIAGDEASSVTQVPGTKPADSRPHLLAGHQT